MKKNLLGFAAVCAAAGLWAQDGIKLAAPSTTGGKPFYECLALRRTQRDFTGEPLSAQQLSNLFYAAAGINRKGEGRLTIPTARNIQDLQVYAAMPSGVYLYNPKTHALDLRVKGDLRESFAARGKVMFRKAAVVLIFVSDRAKYDFGTEDVRTVYAVSHAGYAQQDVGLFCASEGLKNVIIGGFDGKAISKALGLDPKHPVIMCQLVGK